MSSAPLGRIAYVALQLACAAGRVIVLHFFVQLPLGTFRAFGDFFRELGRRLWQNIKLG